MNLQTYLPHCATKRLVEEDFDKLHAELFNGRQITYCVDVNETDEFWVLKGEENDYHLWEVTFHHRLVGENYEFNHALLFSRAVEYSAHDILDQLNAALKAKHPH